jgi:hypothetical protein
MSRAIPKIDVFDEAFTHHVSDSYAACTLCDPPVECAYASLSTAEQPCWGQVMTDFGYDDESEPHACRGHDLFNGPHGEYCPEP